MTTKPDRTFLRHVVFFSSKNSEDVDSIMEGLQVLGTIPSVRTFEVCRNLRDDRFSNEIEVVVYAEFDDEAGLQAYRAHPTYEACTNAVRPMRELRFAADF